MAYHPVVDRYGIDLQSSAPLSQLDFELAAFRLCREGRKEEGDGIISAEEHFVRAAEILWPLTCQKPFIWNSQARFLLHHYCKQKVLAVTGHGSSSKTALSAIWALVNVFAMPNDVMVICVSTDIEGASQSRIYGQIKDFFFAIDGKMSFKLNQSSKTLSPFDPNKLFKFSASAGIKLVSGNANKEKEAEGKIKGYKIGGVHPGRVILIIDEGTDVAAGVYKTYFGNLAGNPLAQLIALANYKPHNAFADLAEPKEGWNTVEPSDQYWETTRGGCCHLDGLQNPNWLAQEDIYPFLQSYTHVQGFYDRGEEDSYMFWEQIRAFPPPVGINESGVWDDAEIRQHNGDRPVLDKEWRDRPVPGVGIDPAFSEGGDKAMAVPWRVGYLLTGQFAIEWLEPISIPIRAGEGNKAPAYQIAEWMVDYYTKWNLDPGLVSYDSTDGNFKAIVQANGGSKFFACPFHGSSTDRIVMQPSGKSMLVKNSDWFANRVSEIWGVGPYFLRAGQLRGIRGQLKVEFTTRRWKESDSINKGRRLKAVEGKREMKKRMKRRSPDTGDAALIGLDNIISVFKLKVGSGPHSREDQRAMRARMIARGQISPRHLARHTQGGSFVSSMFGRPIKRLPPLEDLSKMKLL